MNHQYAIQQQNFVSGYGEEMLMRSSVVYPKPRHVGRFSEPVRSLRLQLSYQQEACDGKVVDELLDIILAKGGNSGGSVEQQTSSYASHVALSPPFFYGSPPSRASNPLVQDAKFGEEKAIPVSPNSGSIPFGLGSSPSSATMKGGCMRVNFGNNPAVRVEGFDCLDRDRRVGRIPALA